MIKINIFSIGLFCVMSATAYADTIVGPGGEPGVATSWKTAGKSVVLTIKDGFSTEEVAEAIERSVPGTKSSAGDTTVTVEGIDKAALLKALARIEVDEQLDDINGAFAALQNPIGNDDGSGSSIRATKERKLTGFSNEETKREKFSGQVMKVVHKKFPVVVLSVKTDEGKIISMIPQIRMKGALIDYSDPISAKNLAAWYCRPGDKVEFTISQKSNKYSIAKEFSRLR